MGNTNTNTAAQQANFQSNQNYDADVRKMFKDFVTGGNTPNDNDPGENVGIDDIRAQISVSITGSKTADLIKALNINPTANTIAPTPNTTTPVLQVQESRCHAFYRIVGFPVVASDMSRFYNPGLDVVKQVDSSGNPISRKITLSTKISIASNIGAKFEALSQARETYASGTAAIFSNPNSVEAGVLSLTSGTYGNKGNINIRTFSAPFAAPSAGPFDFNIVDQAYTNPGNINSTYSLVGNKEVLLANYQDANATQPNPSAGNYKILIQHEHIIIPFMVDPRIDFSIWSNESKTYSGLSKRIAVPFVPDASFLKAGSTSYAERPLLEKVITDRMSQYNQTVDAGQAVSDIVQFVQNFKTIQTIQIGNTPISNIFSNSIFKTSQQDAFALYLSIIQSLMFKLVDAMRIVHAAQGKYYWLPIPANNGPEGGCSIRDVPLNSNISSDLITPDDFNIIMGQVQSIISSVNVTASQSTAVPDRGGYAFSGFFSHKLTFDASTSDSQGDLSSQTMETLTSKRNRLLGKAAEALQVIEMIMGEFSGFGLADIIAIVGSLYIMPLADVVGFLDDDAFARAQTILGSNLPARSSITTSMTSLANSVKAFYQIMDKVFQDYLNNNALNL